MRTNLAKSFLGAVMRASFVGTVRAMVALADKGTEILDAEEGYHGGLRDT